MIEPQTWVADALARMKKAFGPRLAYLGLQGSYRRGEATETSDIDLVVLLDTVEPADLDIYRSIVHALPEGHKACGFCSGTEEFFHWPRHELLPFSMDTDDYYGRLKDFLPPLSQEDALAGGQNRRIRSPTPTHAQLSLRGAGSQTRYPERRLQGRLFRHAGRVLPCLGTILPQ